MQKTQELHVVRSSTGQGDQHLIWSQSLIVVVVFHG